MMATEVAHDDTISRIHINVAKAKIAMTRCWITVKFLIPYHSAGMFHSSSVTSATIAILMTRLAVLPGSYLCSWRNFRAVSTICRPL